MTQVTANDKPLVVAYKIKGVFYNNGSAEAGTGNGPFTEHIVSPGTSFDVPGELIHVRELGAAVPQGGTPDENRGPTPKNNKPSEGGVKTPQGGTPD